MKVKELIQTLQQSCDPESKIEFSDGSTLDNVCYNAGLKRVSIGTMDDYVSNENLAEGWGYIYGEL